MIVYIQPCTFCGNDVRSREILELIFCAAECARAWREERREWVRLRRKATR